MRNSIVVLSMSLVATCVASAQPAVDSVTNAASRLAAALPGGGVAQGARFVIAGKNLGPSDAATGAVPYGTSLGGVSVQVTVSGTTVDAFIVSALATQVVGILPSATPVGTGTLKISYGDQSGTAPIKVVATAVGIYTKSQSGGGPAVALNVAGDGTTAANSLTSSAQPGQSIQLSATGLGAISGNDGDVPPAGDLAVDLAVLVGSKRVTPSSKGRSSDPGNDLITFTLPADVETGCYVGVAVISGQVIGNFSSISVAANGGNCSDPNGLSSSDLDKIQAGGNFAVGTILLSRIRSKFSIPGGASIPGLGGNLEIKIDSGSGVFLKYDLSSLQASTSSGAAQTPIGSCYVSAYQATSPVQGTLQVTYLDAGSLINVNGPKGAKQLKKNQAGIYEAQLGGGSLPISLPIPIPGLPQGQPDYLEAGTYSFDNGSGGADVGGFTTKFDLAAPLVWQNQDSITNVPRNQDLTVTWTGGASGQMVEISGGSSLTDAKAGASFICLASVDAGTFTVPSAVLMALPPSAVIQGTATGTLMVGSFSADVKRFTASGLDFGTVGFVDMSSKNVNYQ